MKLSIFQEEVHPYRADFLLRVRQLTGWDIAVLYKTLRSTTLSPELQGHEVAAKRGFYRFRRYEPLLSHPAVSKSDLLILTFDPGILNLFEMLRAKPTGPRIALWGHGYGRSRLIRPLRHYLAAKADATIFYTEKRRVEFYRDKASSEHKSFVAPNSMVVANHGLGNSDKRHLLYVGRLQQRKRVDVAIDAIALLRARGVPARLMVLGDGEPVLSELKAQANRLGVNDAVTFMPATYEPDALRERFHQAFAYLSPGHVGLGAVHAVSYGVPVITARDVAHAPEVDHLVEGESLFSSGLSADDMADAIQHVMQQDQKALSQACYKRFLQTCTIDHMAEGFIEACRYAVEPRDAGARSF